ncbi:MAG: hypothetical protein Q9170_008146, partial [Blastenia crenularia]
DDYHEFDDENDVEEEHNVGDEEDHDLGDELEETDADEDRSTLRSTTTPSPSPPPGSSTTTEKLPENLVEPPQSPPPPHRENSSSPEERPPASKAPAARPRSSTPDSITFDSKPYGYKVEEYDVPSTTRTRGTALPSDIDLVGLEMAEFLRSDHGYEDGWVGRQPLGSGAQGRAGLWEKIDADGRVLDRVCIKQTKAATLSKYDWEMPQEVAIMSNLLDDGKNNGILQLRSYKRYPRSQAHRLYLEYCEHGDLEKLIAKYRARKRYFPEEFIWDVFYHLAKACRAMDRGPSDEDRVMDEADTYVHCDIKPENIFLASSQEYNDDGIPIYPSARLGDFGIAIVTGVNDPDNPSLYKGRGTMGYKAPEQKLPLHAQPSSDGDGFVEAEITDSGPKFSSQTNIWGTGCIIYKLVWLTDAYYDMHGKNDKHGEALPEIKTKRQPDYSKELCDLVRECLRFRPEMRPTCDQLLKRVRRGRRRFRKPWKGGRDIPDESVLRYTREALDEMDVGTWRKRAHVHEDDMPPSYASLCLDLE